jgi:hypothetical protein
MKYKIYQHLAFASLFLMLSSYTIIKTQLRVFVIDDLGNFRSGAKVSLYEKIEDFNNNKPAHGPIITDNKGKAVFLSLEKGPYYVEAIDGDYSNDFGAHRTDTLEVGKVNKVNIIISK